jgi:CheY-like chemotaxis protein
LEAGDGILGLKLAKLEQPDLILLDIALPQMSGLEVNRRLQSDATTSSIPVLYLTGLVPESPGGANVQDYIAKPFSPRSLIQRVESALPTQPALS